ncbi:ATP-binding protein [Wenyingzhuangia sp. IMCC45574]
MYSLPIYSDSLSISEIIKFEKEGKFNQHFSNTIYKDFKAKEANWIVMYIPKLNTDYFISIENPLFDNLEIYTLKKYATPTKEEHRKKEYRFPLIHIAKENSPCKLFLKVKDSNSYRTEFLITSFSIQEFKKKIEKDYFIIGAYVIGIIVLLSTACIIFLYRREYVIIWYIIHLMSLVTEYLIDNGILGQWFINNALLQKYNIDNIAILISVMSLSEFFRNYYKYNSKTNFCKYIYSGISLFCLIGCSLFATNLLFNTNFNIEHFAHIALNYCSLTSLLVQCLLTYYKIIPKYIFIAFLLPVLGIYANLGGFKNLFDNPNIVYFIYQSVYLGIFINVFVIIFYISKQSIDGEFLSVNLKQENTFLKNSFQENLSKLQEDQQNTIMSDVHDSFGGYIEALRLNLLQKELNHQKINEILEAFKKDYKFLLNSLYVPNINPDNIELAIEEYCAKMDELSSIKINFYSSIDKNSKLPQSMAKLIFKATSELTTNAIKYSKGTFINIDLIIRNKNVFLTVSDDGIGFNKKNIPITSFGIKGLNERILLLNGTFEIKQLSGTSVIIYIPLQTN